MKLNEFGTNDVRGVNNYGSAAFQRKQNQRAGNIDANLTTKETLGKNIFVNNITIILISPLKLKNILFLL